MVQLPQLSKTTSSGMKNAACIGFAGATNVCLQSLTNFSCRLCSPDTGTLLNTSREKWQVVTTGHSLGAGVAVLIAARLREVVAGVQALPIQKDKEVLRPKPHLYTGLHAKSYCFSMFCKTTCAHLTSAFQEDSPCLCARRGQALGHAAGSDRLQWLHLLLSLVSLVVLDQPMAIQTPHQPCEHAMMTRRYQLLGVFSAGRLLWSQSGRHNKRILHLSGFE